MYQVVRVMLRPPRNKKNMGVRKRVSQIVWDNRKERSTRTVLPVRNYRDKKEIIIKLFFLARLTVRTLKFFTTMLWHNGKFERAF